MENDLLPLGQESCHLPHVESNERKLCMEIYKWSPTIAMAPGNVGVWGDPSSTIDWCEENYVVTPLIAEFWNTTSNLLMILAPFTTIFILIKQKFERRFIACHLSLLMVGIGSWCFHMTLLYSMQLLDELPMIWGSAFLIYAFLEVQTPPRRHNMPLQILLILYCSLVTLVYLFIRIPLIFQFAYGVMVVTLVAVAINTSRLIQKCNGKLLCAACLSYGTGFILWNIDNEFCGPLRLIKEVIGFLSPVFELHAWWHILAGLGTYLGLIFIAHTRCIVLDKKPYIKYWFHFWPYLTLDSKGIGAITFREFFLQQAEDNMV